METNKKQYIKIIIIALILILIIAGVFYFLKYKNTNSVEPNVNTGDQTLPVDNQVLPTENKSNENIVKPVADSSVNFEKFNTAMKNARDSFLKRDYQKAISYYDEAKTYKNSDVVYAGYYSVYSSQGKWDLAMKALDSATKLNPVNVDYYNWKLDLLDEKTGATFEELKAFYTNALTKVDPKLKINLIVHFAVIAENNNKKAEAISLWQEAMKVYPTNKDIYQAEIDRLKG